MATTGRSRAQWLAVSLGGLTVAEVATALWLCTAAEMSWHVAVNSFVISNGLMGASFGLSGALIAWHRPANPIGWLFLADGLGHATSSWAGPLVQLIHNDHGSIVAQRLGTTVFLYSWPWSIGLFLPVALLLFPNGKPASPRWWPVVVAAVVTGPLFVIECGTDPTPVNTGLPSGYLTLSSYDSLSWLWMISELRVVLLLAASVLAMVVRYRQSNEVQRRQLLWLLLASMVVVAVVAPWAFVAGTPVAVLFAIPLIPLAVTVAVVRHQLLDIRLVLSRAVAWLLLSAVALGAYVGLVAVLDTFVSARFGKSVFATLLVALGAAPLLPRLQRLVDRSMYGDRRDPVRIASRVSEHLAAADERGLVGVVAAVRSALKLPYVAVTQNDAVTASDGSRPEHVAELPLRYGGHVVGVLEIGLRPGERELAAADHSALQLVAAPLALAVRALGLSAELQASRERIVIGREEERRRLRRDLHDGLGPTLTGVALAADAAANLLAADPKQTRELLESLRRDTRTAIADIRRLVDDLRPPALDELGLLGALRQRADQLSWKSDGSALDVRLLVPVQLPTLPAAIEVAAYRIATEALANVARHARASGAVLELRCDGALELEVTDDGASSASWSPGVGLQAMRERADEVGGRFEAGPVGTGGRVFLSIPLVAT